MKDPTIQTDVPDAEMIGMAPTPQPIGGEAASSVPQYLPPVETAGTPAPPPPNPPQAPPGWIREITPEAPAPPPALPTGQPPVRYAQPTPQPTADPGYVSLEDMALHAVVTNPRGFIGGIVHEALDQRVNPAFAAMTNTAGAVGNYLNAQARVSLGKAQENVEKLYTEVFQQDEAYNSNPNVKRDVDATFSNMLKQGAESTNRGDFEPILEIANLTPLQARAALNAVKTMRGVPGSPVSAPNVGTAVVETPTSHSPITESSVHLTPEEENIIAFRERIDPMFRSNYIESKKIAIERGDFELDF